MINKATPFEDIRVEIRCDKDSEREVNGGRFIICHYVNPGMDTCNGFRFSLTFFVVT